MRFCGREKLLAIGVIPIADPSPSLRDDEKLTGRDGSPCRCWTCCRWPREVEAGAAVGSFFAQQDCRAGEGSAGEGPDLRSHIGDVRVGQLVAHAHHAIDAGLDAGADLGLDLGLQLGKVAGEEEARDGEPFAVDLGGGDDTALLAGVVAVSSGLVVDGHAQQAGQGGLGGGAGEHDAMSARAAGRLVAGHVDQREDALEGQPVGMPMDVGKLDGHGAELHGCRSCQAGTAGRPGVLLMKAQTAMKS